MKSTPAWVLKDNPSYFSNEAQVELTEKRSKLMDVFPSCNCTGADDSTSYSQLGTASSLEELKSTFDKRLGVSGDTLRFIVIQPAVPVPDSVIDRCPAPEWVIMRSQNGE